MPNAGETLSEESTGLWFTGVGVGVGVGVGEGDEVPPHPASDTANKTVRGKCRIRILLGSG
jgi:hypothetical protein